MFIYLDYFYFLKKKMIEEMTMKYKRFIIVTFLPFIIPFFTRREI